MKKTQVSIWEIVGLISLVIAIYNLFQPHFGFVAMTDLSWPAADAGGVILFDILGLWFIVQCFEPYGGNKKVNDIFKYTLALLVAGSILLSIVLSSSQTASSGNTETSISTSAPNSWQTFHSDIDNLTVLLPGVPKYVSSSGTSDAGITFISDSYKLSSDGTTYFVYKYKYSSALSGTSQAILQTSLNGVVSVAENIGYHLVSSNMTSFNQYPSFNFLISNGSDNLKGQFLLLDRSNIILLMVESPNISGGDYEKFVNSLVL